MASNNNYKKVIALGLDYSEFQGGIKECKDEMKKLDSEHKALTEEMSKTASESDKLAEKNDYLTKKIELQNKKVELAKQKMEELANSETATEAQVRKATTAFNNESAELSKLKNELVDVNMQQSNLKESATALVAVLTAVTTAIAGCVKGVAEFADELQTLSAQSGVSVETLQEWDYAAALIDTDFNTMVSSLQKMEKAMAESPEVFRELGVSILDSSGNMRNAEEVFYETIDSLHGIKNATEQDQMAMKVFGKSATELTGVIDAGSKGLKAYGNEAQALGTVLSGSEIEAASKAQDAFDRLGKVIDSAKMKIGVQFAPVAIALANAISQIPAPVLATVAGIAALIAIVVTAVMTITSIVKAFSSLAGVVGLATGALNPNLLIILAITAALAVLAVAIKKIIEYYKEWRAEQEKINEATKGLQANLKVSSGSGYSGGGRNADHKASGGLSRGGMTWVGENGPELVDLPAGSRVYNNNESKQISNSPTYNISMNLDITKLKSVNDVVEAVQGLGMSASVGGAI